MNRASAEQICDGANTVFDAINKLLACVNGAATGERKAAFQAAIGAAIAQIDIHVLESVYNEFPELRPADMPEIIQGK
jgi:hypothetical protein